jgi:hypothetical protein
VQCLPQFLLLIFYLHFFQGDHQQGLRFVCAFSMLSSALAAQISLAEYDEAAVEGAEVFAVEVASKVPPPSSLSCVVAAAAADASFRGLPVF